MRHVLKITVDCGKGGDKLMSEFLHFVYDAANPRVFRRKMAGYCQLMEIEPIENMKATLTNARLHRSLQMLKDELHPAPLEIASGSSLLD